MKKHIRKFGRRLSNLLFDVVECNKFLTGKFPFLLDNLKHYDRISHVRTITSTNLFDLNLFMGKELHIIDYIKKNEKFFQLPPVVDVRRRSFIHHIGEAYAHDEFFLGIHEFIDLLNLKGPIVFSNSSMNCDILYEKFLEKYNLQKKFDVELSLLDFGRNDLSVDGVKIYHCLQEIEYDKGSLSGKKLFCNFNMRARGHRPAMIALLNYYDLLEHNYVTSPTFGAWNIEYNTKKEWAHLLEKSANFLKDLSNLDHILDKLCHLRDRYPLRIDDRTQHTEISQGLLDPLIHHSREDSLFELVSETLVDGSIFFTEKTYIPLVLCKPFILINSFQSLKYFKTLGYRTFEPYINEVYDDIENDAQRCVAICEELLRLKKLRDENPSLFYSNFIEMLEICKENKKVFLAKRK